MLSDWSADNLMQGVDWPPWADTTGVNGIDSLHDIDVLDGYEWLDSWHVDKLRGRTDCEGFYYASSFAAMGEALDVRRAVADRRRRSMRRGSRALQRAMEEVAEEVQMNGGAGTGTDASSSPCGGGGLFSGGDFSVFDEVVGRGDGTQLGSAEDDSDGDEDVLRTGREEGRGAMFVRTRKWLRHMVGVGGIGG